ncbi:MAG: Do family serine endopeptidase [Rhodospirillaceae bacterium]|nr:Do family serine endopeptidase [Rhodospirillaceae bacterium]
MNRWTSPFPDRNLPATLVVLALLAAPATGAVTAARAETGTSPAAAPGAAQVGHAALPDLVARLLPSVVSITTVQGSGPAQHGKAPEGSPFERYFKDYFEKRRSRQRGSAMGSGFIISADGYVVTNNHVIDKAAAVRVILDGGRQLDAKVVGRDPRADLAVLKIRPKSPLPHVRWGDSDSIRIGQDVVAIGNPFGLSQTVTTGILSARGRHLQNFGGIPGNSFVDFLQTDAAINKGNSGGPLFNRAGDVIGVNTAIYSRAEVNAGIAFAVPSNLAAPIVEQLRRYGRTRRGWLGVNIQPVDDELARSLGMESPTGALVANVVAGGPAAEGGIVSGDVILGFDGTPVPNPSRLSQIVAGAPVGKSVTVSVLRDGKTVALTIVLGELEKAMEAGAVQDTPAEAIRPDLFPELGLRLGKITPELAERYKTATPEGVIVLGVEPKGDADRKGVAPGDVIVEMEQTAVATPEAVRKLVDEAKKARKTSALLLIQRGEDRRFVVLKFRLQQGR